MTVTLKLTDGVTTIDLMPLAVETYNPGSSIRMGGASGTGNPRISGVEALLRELSTIDEVIVCKLMHTTVETAYTTIRQIEFLLRQAQEWQDRRGGARVYLQFANTGSTLYRSEIINGNVAYDDEQLRINQATDQVYFSIYFRRAFYWEANDETQIPLLNASVGAKTTNALTIYNGSNAFDNFATIDKSDVLGTMPVPIRMELTNNTSPQYEGIIFAGLATHGQPTSAPFFLNGKDFSGSFFAIDDATCRSGQHAALSATATMTLVVTKSISSAQAIALGGRYYRILARFSSLPSAGTLCYISVLKSGETYEYAKTQISTLSTSHYLQELGVLRLPPWLTAFSTLNAFTLGINLENDTPATVNLDFIALMPTDGFKAYHFIGNGPGTSEQLIDDEILSYAYSRSAGGLDIANLAVYGEEMLIWPGKDQRLYFLAENSSPTMDINMYHGLKLYYRPRRATI